MKVQRIPFEEFKAIYSRVPRLCVEIVYVHKKSILLIRRTIHPGMGLWHTPGGTVLKGEDLKQAVKRVAKEELGIVPKIEKFLGIIEYKSYLNHYSQDISLAFLVSSKKTSNFNLDGHADKYEFFKGLPKNTIKEQKEFYSRHFKLPKSKKNK
ncbi:MAG TPA: NUDIX hydrolase [Candidatus Paceibacterota bacterium]|nr:NUDIX hydrolase [Candidatus Paceibacterota bacterium]